jgi:hypothetical protein
VKKSTPLFGSDWSRVVLSHRVLLSIRCPAITEMIN